MSHVSEPIRPTDISAAIGAYTELEVLSGPTGTITLTTAGDYYLLNKWSNIDDQYSATASIINSNITINKAGAYCVVSNISFKSSDNNFALTITIYKNGNNTGCSSTVDVKASSQIIQLNIIDVRVFSIGDIIDLRVSSEVDNKVIAINSGRFSVFKIG